MNPGKLNRRISFVVMIESENEVGDTVQEPQIVKTVWASVAPITGREYVEAKKYQDELTYKITTRYIKDITPDMQIKYGERLFNIKDIIDPFEKHEIIEIMCIEREFKNGQ